MLVQFQIIGFLASSLMARYYLAMRNASPVHSIKQRKMIQTGIVTERYFLTQKEVI